MSKNEAPLYEWPTPDGRTIHLMPFTRLPSGVIRKSRGLSGLEQTVALIEAGVVDDDQEIVDEIAIEDLDKLLEDWSSEVKYPQSSSSSTS